MNPFKGRHFQRDIILLCASVSYQQMHGFSAEQLRNATHLVWATGGGMVPEEEMEQYLAKGH